MLKLTFRSRMFFLLCVCVLTIVYLSTMSPVTSRINVNNYNGQLTQWINYGKKWVRKEIPVKYFPVKFFGGGKQEVQKGKIQKDTGVSKQNQRESTNSKSPAKHLTTEKIPTPIRETKIPTPPLEQKTPKNPTDLAKELIAWCPDKKIKSMFANITLNDNNANETIFYASKHCTTTTTTTTTNTTTTTTTTLPTCVAVSVGPLIVKTEEISLSTLHQNELYLFVHLFIIYCQKLKTGCTIIKKYLCLH